MSLKDFPGNPESGDDNHYVLVDWCGRISVEYWATSAAGWLSPVLLVPLEESFETDLQKVFWQGAAQMRLAYNIADHQLGDLADEYRQKAADYYGCEPWEI